MTNRPTRTVTFLFTDVEGSTNLWEHHHDWMERAHKRQEAIMREAVARHNGYAYKMIGDAFQVAFATARDALDTAIEAQCELHKEHWGEVSAIRVRMALHTGVTEERGDDYVGPVLNRVARLMSAGHGGQILLTQATFELVRDQLPEGVTLRDLGERRLKDLIRPEHIYQLVASDLPSEFPPLKTLDYRPNNLPAQTTPFIGREKELARVKGILARAEVRLLTMTGVGGTGKTRLALQVAADMLDDFKDGVFLVPLASISDPALVLQTIAQTFDVREAAGRQLADQLKDYLREKQILLVLDNFEQVIDAAPLLADLLSAAPRLKILVTSRELLRLSGEIDYPVPPLSLPDPKRLPPLERLTQYEAVAMFIERAQAVKPDFNVTNENAPAVAEICYQLDGLPLAIELAAARVRMLPPQKMLLQLSDRLKFLTGGARDLPARQQTLRGAIDWSHALLTSDEQKLFRRLAVFVGGCTLEAAESVCSDDGHLNVLNGLQSLMDKSLLKQDEVHGEPRFMMLEMIREYAREKLLESGELDAMQERHLSFFLVLAEEVEPQLRRERQQEYLGRLEREHDNLRTALEWSARMHRDGQMLRLGAALCLFWRLRDLWVEARKWVNLMLALDVRPEHEALRQKILAGAAYIAMMSGDLESAEEWARTCLESSQMNGERRRQGKAFTVLGFVAWQHNKYAEAQIHLEQAMALLRQVEDQMGVADAFHWLGHVALDHGDYARARSFFQDSYARLKEFGDRVSITLLLSDLGLVYYLQEDYVTARAYCEQNLELCREIESKLGMGKTLNQLGDLARCEGDYGRADALYSDSLSLFKEIGNVSQSASVLHNLAHVRLSQGEGEQAAILFNQSLNEFRKMDDKKGVMDCLTGLAGVAIQFGQPEKGARLLGACEKVKQEIGTTWWPANHIAYNRDLSSLHEQLDDATFNAAWKEGGAMTLEQAIAYALQELATLLPQ